MALITSLLYHVSLHYKSGVSQIADLLDENNKFLTFNNFCEKYQNIKTNFLI